MDIAAALKAFAAVFPAELPDKTMVVTIVLMARFRRPLAVWSGTAAAYGLHVSLAAAAGSLLVLLPEVGVTVATAGLFAVGAVLLWRSAKAHADEARSEMDAAPGNGSGASTGFKAFAASFGLLVVAEWGDMSQLVIAGLAGSTGSPVGVAVGGLAAMLTVSAIAVTAGQGLVKRLPLDRLQQAAAFVFAGLAGLTLLSLA